MAEIADELRKACSGHPHAKIAWPHRLLHRAADELDAKDKQIAELEAALGEIADPIAAPPAKANAKGLEINGYFAVQLSNDAGYLKGIASRALSRLLNKEDRNG